MILAASTKLLPENQPLSESKPLRRGLRRLFRSVLIFFIGLIVGMLILSISLLSIGGSNAPLPVAATTNQSGNTIVHVDSTVLVPLVEKGWQQSNTPGSISQVQVQFVAGDLMTITGTYQISMFGISLTRPFSIQVQPMAEKCSPQLHILHVSFSGIPITGFIASFEKNINQQLQQIAQSLAVKFTYCLTGMRTDSTGLIANIQLSNLAWSREAAML